MPNNYILEMITTLREKEEVVLSSINPLIPSDIEKKELGEYLSFAYLNESTEYPFTPPPFNAEAAIWAAQLVYTVAQFIVNRQTAEKSISLSHITEGDLFTCNPSTVLSTDLCLRFIPDFISQLKLIDERDKRIPLLEAQLKKWHYSGVQYTLPLEELNFELILSNDCLTQLYLNRIIKYKNISLAKHKAFNHLLKANLGIFESDYWNELNLIKENK